MKIEFMILKNILNCNQNYNYKHGGFTIQINVGKYCLCC